jgi:hypothetical protein
MAGAGCQGRARPESPAGTLVLGVRAPVSSPPSPPPPRDEAGRSPRCPSRAARAAGV